MTKLKAELDLETDARFQRSEWRAQRIGWIIWSLIVVAACLGLLGPGWLSDREAISADGGLTVGYDRFLHYHHPSQLTITCHGVHLDSDAFGISVARSLLDQMQILRIDPEPVHSQVADNSVIYEFRRDPRANAGKVVFHVEYERYGNAEGEIALMGGDPVTLRQFVYP
jgi:hypothetical protein